MRISDWSSDVCSSDLQGDHSPFRAVPKRAQQHGTSGSRAHDHHWLALPLYSAIQVVLLPHAPGNAPSTHQQQKQHGVKDRKSVVQGKSVAVRVDLGGRRCIKNKKNITKTKTHT